MAMVMDQEQRKQEHEQEQARHKHYCRICRKGFGCGRALGGHMRVHGINDEQAHDLDDDPPPNAAGSEWDDKQINAPAGSKRMYALRNNATRLRTYCVCENCGKEFPSWKSFLEHGRCNSDDDPDEFSPPMSPPPSDDGEGGPATGWYKGKRSRRAKPSSVTPPPLTGASTEEEDLANCLIMLSAARVDPVALIAETEESSASASKEDDDDRAISMRYRPPTSTPPRPKFPVVTQPIAPIAQPVPRGMFECKACKKVFTSHQALGGHRASHKKVKGCFAAKLDPDPDESTLPDDEMDQIGFSPATSLAIVPFIDNPQPAASTPLKKKSKVHECSICRRQFASGQALGGHKRCHWITSSSGSVDPVPTVSVKLHHHMPEVGSSSGAHHHDFTLRPMFDSSEALDLNLPAPADDLAGIPLRLDAPTAFYIKPPWGIDRKGKVVLEASVNDMNNNSNDERNQQDLKTTMTILDDEAESKVKLAKLSDLKDMNEGGESSPWLQVGIGGSAADRDDGCQDINN